MDPTRRCTHDPLLSLALDLCGNSGPTRTALPSLLPLFPFLSSSPNDGDSKDKKAKKNWEDLNEKEITKADEYWLSGLSSSRPRHPILSLTAPRQPKDPEALRELLARAQDFVRDKLDSFDFSLAQGEHSRTRHPFPNEIASLLATLQDFTFSILETGLIPKGEFECLNWRFRMLVIQEFIENSTKHLKINITNTRFKQIGKAQKRLAAQAKLYFGAQEWSKHSDEDLLPKTSSSSSVLVEEDLAVDPSISTNFRAQATEAAPILSLSERKPAVTNATRVNETSSNLPNVPDTLTVREQASSIRTSLDSEIIKLRKKESDADAAASSSDKEDSDVDINYDEYDEHDEYDSYDSGSDNRD